MGDNNFRHSIVSNLAWKFGERILARVVEFLISLILARILLPSDYGIVAMVLVFISLADVFVTSGFATSLIQKKDADILDFSTMFYCSLASSVIIYFVLYFCATPIANFYNQPILIVIIRVFALKIPLGAYNSIQHAYVSRHMLFKRFFWSTLIGTLISGFVGILLALYGFGVWALVAQYFTNTIVDTLVLALTVPWRPRLEFSLNAAKPLMRYGWKILLASLSGTFFDQLRSLIIGRVFLPSDLAFYNRGKQFPSLITNNISNSAVSVLFPAISNVSDNIDRVKEITRKAIKAMSYLIFPMLVGLGVVAKPLVLVLLTDKWSSSIPYIRLFCISAALSVLGDTSLQAIKAIGRSDVLLRLEFIKKPVYLILLIIGVRFGVIAIAVTMVLYSLYGTFINTLQLQKYIKYTIREQIYDIAPVLVMSSLMGAIVVSIENVNLSNLLTLIIQLTVGIITYILMSIITKNSSFFYIVKILIVRGKKR